MQNIAKAVRGVAGRRLAKQRRCVARHRDAWLREAQRSTAKQSKGIAVQCSGLLIQDVGDAEEIFRRPEVNVNCFCCPGVGMPEACADELNGNAFFIQDCAEIMSQGMRTEARNAGVPGKFFTEAVHAASELIALCKFNSGRIGLFRKFVKNILAGFIERDQSLSAAFSD